MLSTLGSFFMLGFAWGFVARPIIKAAEERQALSDLIATHSGSGSR